MKIPANAQVALQSVKVNVDGRVAVDSSNSTFFQYFGQKLNTDGTTAPQINDVTSQPVEVNMVDPENDQVVELNRSDFANQLRRRIEASTFHPNQKGKVEVEVDTGDTKPYKITYDSNNTSTNNRPATMENFGFAGSASFPVDPQFTFTSHKFTRTSQREGSLPCVGIAPEFPISNASGSNRLVVNLSSATANANASGVPWAVGLSRYVQDESAASDGLFAPEYFAGDHPSDYFVECLGFCDFAVCRNSEDELVLLHAVWDSDLEGLSMEEIEYWNNTNGSVFSGSDRFDLSGGNYDKVEFQVNGEDVKAFLHTPDPPPGLKAGAGAAAAVGQNFLICDFVSAGPQNTFFKPVNQACWCLHPVIGIDFDRTNASDIQANLSCTAEIEHFNGLEITGYDAKTPGKGGWYESLEGTNGITQCMELEQRPWNVIQDREDFAYQYVGYNASDDIDYDHVLILTESEIYPGTNGANARSSLGFERAVIDNPVTTGSKSVFTSTTQPDLSSTQALFVRLNNVGQQVTNARMKNKSTIIAHLPRFDNALSTGRLHFEPNNLIFLDLNNPNPIHVNEFQISFCYVNEQFARILTGQSIACLMFREKPK
jgi:hypothetical protein